MAIYAKTKRTPLPMYSPRTFTVSNRSADATLYSLRPSFCDFVDLS